MGPLSPQTGKLNLWARRCRGARALPWSHARAWPLVREVRLEGSLPTSVSTATLGAESFLWPLLTSSMEVGVIFQGERGLFRGGEHGHLTHTPSSPSSVSSWGPVSEGLSDVTLLALTVPLIFIPRAHFHFEVGVTMTGVS